MRRLLVLALLVEPAAAAPSARCVIDPLPAKPAATTTVPPCHQAPAKDAATIRAAIAKRYYAVHDRGKPEVTFGCDGLGPRIREIVIETGSGHGGYLALWRARRGTGTSYDVRGIIYQGDSMVQAAATPPFQIATGTVELPELELVRASVAATVREVAPPPKPGTIGGMRGGSSSRNFHLLVRLTDDDGRVLERRYTGYEGTSGQDVYLGLEVAAGSLGKVTALAGSKIAPTDLDRALFLDRFAASVPHFDDQFYWWVMERQVDLARHLGTRATIPGLLTRLVVTKPDRAKIDARVNAVDALARITGWDARTGRSLDDAAALYLAECKTK